MNGNINEKEMISNLKCDINNNNINTHSNDNKVRNEKIVNDKKNKKNEKSENKEKENNRQHIYFLSDIGSPISIEDSQQSNKKGHPSRTSTSSFDLSDEEETMSDEADSESQKQNNNNNDNNENKNDSKSNLFKFVRKNSFSAYDSIVKCHF